MMNLIALVEELRLLRKGRGVHVDRIGEKTGSELRQVCGIAVDDGEPVIRRKVVEQLTELSAGLPEDLRTCFGAAFALIPECRLPFYQNRLEWAGQQIHREVRTVRRRVDDAVEMVAQNACASRPPSHVLADRQRDWYTDRLDVCLMLTERVPEVFEFRRIISVSDGLAGIGLSWSVTPKAGEHRPLPVKDLDITVLAGGRLERRGLAASSRMTLSILFSRPLRRHQTHDIALRVRGPQDRPTSPHYVCTPLGRCDRFGLRVVFPPANPPDRVQLLNGVLQGEIDDDLAVLPEIPVDGTGEAVARFADLLPYVAYGMRWG